MSQHVLAPRVYFQIFGLLLLLLFLTVGAAYIDLEWANLPVAMAIAVAKALLILLYFMHVKYSTKLTWAFAGASFLWLGIMMTLFFQDYLSRDWLPIPGK